jgi:hypothetical protein
MITRQPSLAQTLYAAARRGSTVVAVMVMW